MKQSIRDINYEHLAVLAKDNAANFELLCKRAEEGARTDAELLGSCIRQPDSKWLTTPQAAERLAMTYSTFVSTLMAGELDYFGIEHRSRSRIKPKGRRGCGVLYKCSDLDEIVRVRQVLKSSNIAALRVFQAKRQGLL